ncbi:MAG: hypothetical protein KDD70_08345 [Bdellovibrionales bacterium]|nr:hypothetical protein [Bdellovibrionales bacterium]
MNNFTNKFKVIFVGLLFVGAGLSSPVLSEEAKVAANASAQKGSPLYVCGDGIYRNQPCDDVRTQKVLTPPAIGKVQSRELPSVELTQADEFSPRARLDVKSFRESVQKSDKERLRDIEREAGNLKRIATTMARSSGGQHVQAGAAKLYNEVQMICTTEFFKQSFTNKVECDRLKRLTTEIAKAGS